MRVSPVEGARRRDGHAGDGRLVTPEPYDRPRGVSACRCYGAGKESVRGRSALAAFCPPSASLSSDALPRGGGHLRGLRATGVCRCWRSEGGIPATGAVDRGWKCAKYPCRSAAISATAFDAMRSHSCISDAFFCVMAVCYRILP